jgi:hypothetical protein
MKYSEQKQSMNRDEVVRHSTSQQNQQAYSMPVSEDRALNSQLNSDNSVVDAFEYEPMGYMSNGRW